MQRAPGQTDVDEHIVERGRVEPDGRLPLLIDEPQASQNVIGVALAEAGQMPDRYLIDPLDQTTSPEFCQSTCDPASKSGNGEGRPVCEQEQQRDHRVPGHQVPPGPPDCGGKTARRHEPANSQYPAVGGAISRGRHRLIPLNARATSKYEPQAISSHARQRLTQVMFVRQSAKRPARRNSPPDHSPASSEAVASSDKLRHYRSRSARASVLIGTEHTSASNGGSG